MGYLPQPGVATDCRPRMGNDFAFFTVKSDRNNEPSRWCWRRGDTVSKVDFPSLYHAIANAEMHGFVRTDSLIHGPDSLEDSLVLVAAAGS